MLRGLVSGFRNFRFVQDFRRIFLAMGFASTGAVGAFGVCKKPGGLNFKICPHYSDDDCPANNLKCLMVAMMLEDGLNEDDAQILLSSVGLLYDKESCQKDREDWCSVELRNFMNCAEQCGSLKDPRCTTYQKMLKSCLQSKKDASYTEPPKICQDEETCCKPATIRRRLDNLYQKMSQNSKANGGSCNTCRCDNFCSCEDDDDDDDTEECTCSSTPPPQRAKPAMCRSQKCTNNVTKQTQTCQPILPMPTVGYEEWCRRTSYA